MEKKNKIASLLILISVLAIACVPTSNVKSPETTYPSGAIEIRVSAKEFKPSVVTVPMGTTVTWINQEGDAHTVTRAAGVFDGVLDPVRGSFSYTFNQTGSFEYHCNVHDYHVMAGSVIVK